jgi:hypothetical protein
MKKYLLIVVMLLLASTAAFAEARESYADIDQQMIELLALNHIQAKAYVAIIEKQRVSLLALQARQWQQELALYQQTFAMLKPVLTHRQYATFVAIIDSVIEDPEDQELLVMGE